MIKVFSSTFEFITEIDAFENSVWTTRWHKQGDFQIVLNQGANDAHELMSGRIVNLGKDKTGIISHVEEDNSNGKGMLLVKGFDLKGLLSNRITVPPVGEAQDKATASIESLMKQFVNNNAVTTTPERIIEDLVLAPNLNRGAMVSFQTRYKNLLDELEKLSILSGLGWDIVFDGSSYVFDVVEGRDLSIMQTANPPVIFSNEFGNTKSQKVIESSLDYKNVAIVAGQGEGADREVIMVGGASGLDRKEVFIDARDIEEGGNLLDRGEQKLAEYAKIESFETSVLSYGPFKYGEDWRIGDIVTVQNESKTRTAHLRVTEIVEVIDQTGHEIDATFGQPLPTIIEKIKRETDNPIAEGGGSEGVAGVDGTDGASLNFIWQDTSLGVKRDDETVYQYTDLKGDQGIQGIQGETGLQGPTGAVQTYMHNQISASTIWTVNHNLNKYPHVAIIDSAGSVVHGDVDHIDMDTLEIIFTTAFSGKANII